MFNVVAPFFVNGFHPFLVRPVDITWVGSSVSVLFATVRRSGDALASPAFVGTVF